MHRIFFVHDAQEDPSNRAGPLEAAGYDVARLRSETELLAALQQELPAMILMDVLLEGINGFEACRKVRTLLEPTQMPIILGSHIYRSRVYRDEAQAAGAQRYLRYPMDPDDLVLAVNEVILEAQKALRPS